MADKTENYLADIGYLYHYPRLDHPTDKFRLDIYISENPEEQVFGIKRARFYIQMEGGDIGRLTVTHPWNFEKKAHVCAGLIILEDQRGNKEEAFSFGGSLKIDDQKTHTICSLVTNAPIIEITSADPMRRMLFEEVDILFAERSAAYSDHEAYETNLCKADPLTLYVSCLGELIRKFEGFPNKDDQYRRFLVYLHSQQHRLNEASLFKLPTPDLEDIL